jgi:diguanylate cyclase (GGDEF)-like protein/PAS domain S-box-containing protein
MIGRTSRDTDRNIKASFTASLFDNPGSLLVGGVIQGLAFILAYAETGSTVFLALLFMAQAIMLWRYSLTMRFHREKPDLSDPEIEAAWDRQQLVGIATSALTVGLFGYFGIHSADSQFTQLAASVIVMATASTVLGKYYGSKRHTIAALLCLAGPYIVALLLRLDPSHTLLAILSIPFVAMISKLADRLRSTLFESTKGRIMLSEIADRFNAALNNMPHGLIMIDEAARIEVVNRQFFKVFGFNDGTHLDGRSLNVVFTLARREGLFESRSQAEAAGRKVRALVEQERGGRLTLELTADRHVQVTTKRRSKGGAVLVIEDISARVIAERKIERMARYDEMTQLFNRAWFKENVERVLADPVESQKGHCALFAIDVDDFKSINDTYGHATGDELLIALAANLNKLGKRNVMICRHGGDEYSVFAWRLKDAAAAAALAGRIVALGNATYDLSNCRYNAALSLGYATSRTGEVDFQTLMIRADLALYARKADKSLPHRAYEEELDRQQRERMQLKSDLGTAIRDGALTLVYQPQIDMKRGRLASCEALIRWSHPVLGPISPSVFVPIAEQMGIVSDMTRFVIAESARACASWSGGIGVSVNLSAIDFEQDGLAEYILDSLKAAGLDPSRFEVEITESAAIKGEARVKRVLNSLRQCGVRVALDDFGVGYSGLSHLNALPLDSLKIDRSFILEVNDSARSLKLLSSVISLAGALDLKVTVEGIEDQITLERVMSAGPIEKVQGFVFGAHFTANQVSALSSHQFALGPAKKPPAKTLAA